jgi:2'-5' RNA ligase
LAENAVQRLFFGLWPDPAARQRLAALGTSLDVPGGRPVHPEDLHLTLQFLGPVPAQRLAAVLAAAEQVDGAPFELLIARTGYWRRPRIVWCAPLDTPPDLAALVSRLGERLAAVGYPPESRPYSPHVTLARKARGAPNGPLAEPIRWPATSFVLAASESVPEPPRYRILRRWPLRGGAAPAADLHPAPDRG